mmetsp:Transcript_16289/g.29009  ORF Transcript_16289/g.29009 Transcript_16289/m.29009 type:complete len:331 (-) Transcript_16289:297-1289(-)
MLELGGVHVSHRLESLAGLSLHAEQQEQVDADGDGGEDDGEEAHDGGEGEGGHGLADLVGPGGAGGAGFRHQVVLATFVLERALATGAANVGSLHDLAPDGHIVIHNDGVETDARAQHAAQDDMEGHQIGPSQQHSRHTHNARRSRDHPVCNTNLRQTGIVLVPDKLLREGDSTGEQDCAEACYERQCPKVDDVPTHSHSGVVSHHKLLIIRVFLICKERASATQKRSRLIKIRGAALEAVGGAAVSPATRRHGCYLLLFRRPSTAIFLPLGRHTAHESPSPPSVALQDLRGRGELGPVTVAPFSSARRLENRGGQRGTRPELWCDEQFQ